MLLAPALLALASQTPAQTSTTLADLVPKGTVAFVQSPSLERAAKFVDRLASAFAPAGGQTIDVAKLLAMIELPADAAAVDPARPVGVCLVLGEGGQPLPAFLIPVRDADAFLKSLAKPGSPMKGVAKGGYACIGFGAAPELPSAPAAIAKGLPEGEISLRLDLKSLVEQFREQIDQGLDELEAQAGSASAAKAGGFDPAPMMGAYMDGVRDVVDSAETLDIATRLEGDELELGFKLTNAEGSALAAFGSKEKTSVRALASLLDADSGMSALMGMDMTAMTKRFQPLFDAMPAAYPESMRPAMKQMFGHMSEFYGFMGTAQAVSMDFSDAGLRYRIYSRGGDPTKLLEAYRSLAGAMPGFAISDVPQREVAGVKVSGVRLKIDIAALSKAVGEKNVHETEQAEVEKMMERMFGKDGMLIQVATKDDTALMVLGGDDDYLRASLGRISAKPSSPTLLARALQQVGDLNPCMIVHFDLGRMLDGLKSIVADMAPGGAADFPAIALGTTFWGGVDGRAWLGALDLNLSEIVALSKLKDGKPPKTK